MHIIRPKTIQLALLALICAAFTSCAVNPATGRPDFVLMTESGEISMGRKQHEELLKTVPIYQDEKLQAYIEEVGQRIAKNSDRPDLEYHFTIIDDENVNAFAAPGGYIYINRGILQYLQSEAQLAAVLGHEVAHVTARHTVRDQTRELGAGILDFITVVATQDPNTAAVTNIYSQAALSGYGREMELEADRFGAKYLYNSGYPPESMVEVVGVLKDQETYNRRISSQLGRKNLSYHGVFASHPRNDRRFREIIQEAGKLKAGEERDPGYDRFREVTDGMVYGQNFEARLAQFLEETPNRFIDNTRGFTILFPEGWKGADEKGIVIGSPEEKNASIKIEVKSLGRLGRITPVDYVKQELNIPVLRESEELDQARLKGITGFATQPDGTRQRIAVLFRAKTVYVISTKVEEAEDGIDYDTLFTESIATFAPIEVFDPTKVTSERNKHLVYVKANDNTKYDRLAESLNMGPFGADQLRLLNGHYPRGEPRPGEWIKIVK